VKQITASGKTVDEAIQTALDQLQTTKDRADITIIDEGKKGIFGVFGSKPAVVKVSIAKDPVEETAKFIKQVSRHMNIEIDVSVKKDKKQVTYDLYGENIALLIGKRGKTLNALQLLAQTVINKDSEVYYTVTLDADGYRQRRRETLTSLAKRKAALAKQGNKPVKCDPMPAFERKIIHHALQNDAAISTTSEGREPNRCIVIKPSDVAVTEK